ncbi:juvenile hormone esterase isoform X2 [Spodoptera frugiperda]|uniref:Juvenile hormone esterase isoform X2 n=1 Tax=Spodoptera frugiperda TaxID=7108 RepID=A0A9R0DQ79_SPOFR|nr:juvenile hormone esterase isoform X2 [Spodoptera frugiperda]
MVEEKPPNPVRWFNKPVYNYSVPYNESCALGFTEDCLYLSIYTPINKHTTLVPVIVWIHEYAYTHGPDFLIDENVNVVTVSFRTTIFGFLNTGDSFASGNMGAKDVLTALRWIRDNIGYFNGDINKVTVFGSGSTAPIVASLLLSAAGEDLFSRLIIQDGSALSPADYRSYNFEIMNKLYWNLNGPFEKFNRTKLYELLSKSSVKQLFAASYDLFDSTEVRDNQRLINSFSPTVEVSGKGAFMNKFPFEVYKRKITNNAVEVMIGYTNLDSLHKLDGFVRNRKLLKYLNYNFQYLLPFEGRKDEYGSKLYRKIRKKIMDFYFVNGTVGERSLRRYAKYVSDQVIYPILRQASLQSQVSCSNVYLYRFTHRGPFSIVWNTYLRNLNLNGATSGDEICYQFKCKSLKAAYNTVEVPNERLLIKKIARLLANFAKHGNPTPHPSDPVLEDLQWLPLEPSKSMRVLNIGSTLKMVKLPEQERMLFWDRLRNDFFPSKEINDEL